MLRSLEFQLSYSPDTNGRIHRLLDCEPPYNEDANLPDSLPDATLEAGQTAEGYVYFRAPNGETASPPEALTVLWHGDYMFEQPIMLE